MDLASQFMDANQLISFYEKIKKIDKRNLTKSEFSKWKEERIIEEPTVTDRNIVKSQ